MSQADLNALERDVEQARARFANDLARLRSPVNLARFKDELWAESRETKDELDEKTKEAAKDGAQRVLTQLTERVAANPAAALAIGAGVAWRLFHRPPIATLLVGLGLVGLLRASPSQADYAKAEDFFDPEEWKSRASALTDAAKQKVQDLSAQAAEAAHDAKAQVTEAAASAA